ncbi:hypothetical protein V8C35DRAFT_187638 [Trichoderma chlorosporum]
MLALRPNIFFVLNPSIRRSKLYILVSLSVSGLPGQICLASCFVAALDKNNLVLDHGVLFISVHLRSLFYHYPYLYYILDEGNSL